jgi:hypothetical protein
MTTNKWMPGPWRVGDAGLTVFGPPNGTPSPVTIAHCPVNPATLFRANARLIAAAPEMAGLLQNLSAMTDGGRFDLTDSPKSFISNISELAMEARALLARIDGGD